MIIHVGCTIAIILSTTIIIVASFCNMLPPYVQKGWAKQTQHVAMQVPYQ